MNFRSEDDSEKLFAPQNTRALADREWVEDRFGDADASSRVYLEGSRNLLSREGLEDAFDVHEFVTALEAEKKTRGYDERSCAQVYWRPTEDCQKVSILSFWDFNRTRMRLDEDLVATVNNKTAIDCCSPTSRTVDLASVAGKLRYDGTTVTSIGSFRMVYYLEQSLNRKSRDDPHVQRLERKFDRRLRDNHWPSFETPLTITSAGLGDNSSRAFDHDRIFINMSLIIIITYAFFALYDRRRPDRSRGLLGLGAVGCVLLSTVGAFGLVMAFGLGFSPSTTIAIYLVLGIGLDDSFVIAGCLEDDTNWSLKDAALEISPKGDDDVEAADEESSVDAIAARRITHAMATAGPSILVTSVTDACAFFAGSFVRTPDIANFNKFCCAAVIVDWLMQITFFVALATLDMRKRLRWKREQLDGHHREKKKKSWWPARLWWWTKGDDDDDEKKTVIDQRDPLATFFGGRYARWLLSPVGKIFVLCASGAALSMAIVGCVRAEMDIPQNALVFGGPEEKALDYEKKHYSRSQRMWVGIYTKATDYFTHREDLRAVVKAYEDQPFALDGAGIDQWYDAFEASSFYSSNVTSSDEYTEALTTFLSSNEGLPYSDKVVFDNGVIVATQIDTYWLSGKKTRGDFKRYMRDSRKKVRKNADPGLGTVIVWNSEFLWFESFVIIAASTIQGMLIAVASVLVVLIILLGDAVAALLVASTVAFVCVATFGSVYLYGDQVNYISAFFIVIAVGLSTDAPAHVCRAFLESQYGSRHDRVVDALTKLGPSVFRGGISTILGIAITGACITYVFASFFKYLMTILCLALWNGVALMPVLLSLVGPPSLESGDFDAALTATAIAVDGRVTPEEDGLGAVEMPPRKEHLDDDVHQNVVA